MLAKPCSQNCKCEIISEGALTYVVWGVKTWGSRKEWKNFVQFTDTFTNQLFSHWCDSTFLISVNKHFIAPVNWSCTVKKILSHFSPTHLDPNIHHNPCNTQASETSIQTEFSLKNSLQNHQLLKKDDSLVRSIACLFTSKDLQRKHPQCT